MTKLDSIQKQEELIFTQNKVRLNISVGLYAKEIVVVTVIILVKLLGIQEQDLLDMKS